jgi:hypothetical protein
MTESSPSTTTTTTTTTTTETIKIDLEQQQEQHQQKGNNPQENASELPGRSNTPQSTQNSNETVVLRRSTRQRKRPRPFLDELAGEQGNVKISFSIFEY